MILWPIAFFIAMYVNLRWLVESGNPVFVFLFLAMAACFTDSVKQVIKAITDDD